MLVLSCDNRKARWIESLVAPVLAAEHAKREQRHSPIPISCAHAVV